MIHFNEAPPDPFFPSQRGAPKVEHKSRQPSKAVRRAVKNAFDPDKLIDLCTTWDFSEYATRLNLEPHRDGRERFYWYKDNGSDVLAVAHLDSVQQDGTCSIMKTSAGLLATSGALDDRLGVYVILELLPKLGITCDWLLTTDEEIGQSTADAFFVDHKDYHWMIQFDRGGTDVVMYQYETRELCALVEDSGARVGDGIFSDICVLDHLGAAGFNWGVGYRDYHSARSHAWLEDTFRMVARFVKFYEANGTTALPYRDDDWDRRDIDIDDGIEWVVVDCGHEVNFEDESTFVESGGGQYVDCADCGTMPDDLAQSA